MAKQELVREVLLYTERIKMEDVKNFFNQILKSRIPLIDFTDILSINVVQMIVKRKLNTVQFFIKERKALEELSMLVFPYKIAEPVILQRSRGSYFPLPKFYFMGGSQDFLSFTLKESVDEISLRVIKILGKFLAFGYSIDDKGKKSIVICTTPERFLIVDLEKNPSVYIEVLELIPKRMSVSSQYPIFEETGITVGVDNFDVFQHTLLVGASGTGKSKAIYALVKAIEARYQDDIRIVIIDPHGEFVRMFPEYKLVDLINNYIEPLDVGGIKTPLMTQLIAQLLSSSIGQENKYSERVLFYATHLLSSIDKMDLKNISMLLTDSSKRAEFISETENDEVKRFFDEEFNDIYIHHFNDAVLPILNFVGEYELYLGGKKKRESLLDLIKHNKVTVVSFNPNFFGKRMINFLAGAVTNQMYILAITERLDKKTILVMDEFQRVETKVVRDILAETRKFNLYVYLSMQYLGQLTKEIHDSIISNIRNIVSFKANRQDATMLSSIMEIKIEESFKKSRSQTELEESKKEMFVRLHQRECIVRLFDGKKYILPMKLRVVDVNRWGYKESGLSSQEKAVKIMEQRDEVQRVQRERSAGSSPPPAEPDIPDEPEEPRVSMPTQEEEMVQDEPKPAKKLKDEARPKEMDWMGMKESQPFGQDRLEEKEEAQTPIEEQFHSSVADRIKALTSAKKKHQEETDEELKKEMDGPIYADDTASQDAAPSEDSSPPTEDELILPQQESEEMPQEQEAPTDDEPSEEELPIRKLAKKPKAAQAPPKITLAKKKTVPKKAAKKRK